uniref:Immunoglobulin V-set domain-containing protein n=1 Tax=Hucho hucho TaxID=62062 RepID=A0A4W5QJ85_9TELE
MWLHSAFSQMSVRRRKSVQSQRFITALRMSWIVSCLFCVLRQCVGTEALTETLVEFGRNATLNCSLNGTNVHWYIQHHPQPPLAILRSFTSSCPVAFYYNNNYRQILITNRK